MSGQSQFDNRDEIAEVIKRASEIEAEMHRVQFADSELTYLIEAASEAGLSREATMQAVRERFSLVNLESKPGELVFALSEDGRWYAARVQMLEGLHARVKFLSGTPATVLRKDLILFSLSPGMAVEYDSPSSGLWSGATLARVNVDAGSATVKTFGAEVTVPFESIRLPREKTSLHKEWVAKLWAVAISCTIGGGVLGAILNHLLTR